MCLRLWNRSKQGYEELKNCGFFKLPSGRTLQLRKNSVTQSPGFHDNLLLDMHERAQRLKIPATEYHGFIVFDEMSIQSNIEMKSVGDEFELTGLVDVGNFNRAVHTVQQGKEDIEMATHVLQFVYHGCEGLFQYPYAYFPTAKLNGTLLMDLYWEGIAALLSYGFNAHMGICDGGQANRSLIMLHFESESHAIKSNFVTLNPYNDEQHVFMMDPSHNFKKLRNNIEKSCSSGKTTRHLLLGGKEILWRHWRRAYEFDCQSGIRTFHLLSDEHFELTPSSRMRNHLADDVLSQRMIELMKCHQNAISEIGEDASALEKTVEFLENTSLLLKNFKSKCPYKTLDDSRFAENESVIRWFNDWESEAKNTSEITAGEKARRFISQKTIFDITSMVKGFQSYCKIMMHLFEGLSIVSHKTSQDYVELFFACQRAQHGQNNNPTEWQYGSNINAINHMRDLKIAKSNCGKATTFS